MAQERIPFRLTRAVPAFMLAGLVLAAPAVSPAFARQAGAAAAPAQAAAAPKAAPKPAPLTQAERAGSAAVRVEAIREVTAALSAPEMEGRGTGAPGGERAAKYIADRFAKIGLKPLGDNGTYLQAVKFRTSQVMPESAVTVGDVALKLRDDYVPSPPLTAEAIDGAGALAFVGYGVASEELKRDDFAGIDLKGKFAVVLSGQPKNVDAAAWAKASNPQALFINIIQKGAAGIVILNVGDGEHPFPLIADYLTRRSAALADTPEMPFKLPPVLLVSDAGAEKLFAKSGKTYAAQKALAETGAAASLDLGATLTAAIRIKKEEATGSNVAAVLEGSDPALKEQAIVYSAHYDAFGKTAAGVVYPGAADNALGVGEIVAIAEAFAKAPARPRRSLIFLAVTGEEHGLLGSEYYAGHPTWPIDKIAADINFDGIGTEIYGPVRSIVAFGEEYSDMAPLVDAVVAASGAAIVADPFPEEHVFYRSDHYSFVKRGVPSVMLLGAPAGDVSVTVARAKKWMASDYHMPTDTIKADWDWSGARDVAAIGYVIGSRVAAAAAMPTWNADAPFNHPRGAEMPHGARPQ